MCARTSWAISLVLVACTGGSAGEAEPSPSQPAASRREPSGPSPDSKAAPDRRGAASDSPATADSPTPAPRTVVEAEPRPSGPPIEPEPVEFRAADGVRVHAVHYPVEQDEPRTIVLLFHQANSNAAEYAPIAPKLQAIGYAALAVDQRSGAPRFGRDNLTVAELGASTGYGKAYLDMEAALAWAQQQGHTRVLAWGSSYSAALVFRLGAEHGDAIAAILAFSPGEYMSRKGVVAEWAAQTTMPVFVTALAGTESIAANEIADQREDGVERFYATRGKHGSSTLHETRNPQGHAEIWSAVETFLRRVAP